MGNEMGKGYVRLHRDLDDCEVFQRREKYCRKMAWVDLIMLAAYKPCSFYVRNIEVRLERGQVGWSEVGLSKRWKWSREKVRRFLAELSRAQMIVKLSDLVCHSNESEDAAQTRQQTIQQNFNVTSIISIINYDKYQASDTANETANKTADETANETRIIKEETKDKRKKKKTQYADDPLFEKFWEDYPCNGNTGIRGDKQRTFRFWLALQNGDRELAVQRLAEYKLTQSWIDGFSVHATKFLQETFRYPAPQPKLKSKNPHFTISQDFENKDYSDTGDFLNAEQFLENLKKKEV